MYDVESSTSGFCSLQAFSVVFDKAIDKADPSDEVKQRVKNLIDCITYSVFVYTTRGLFEKDKLIFITQMTFQVRASHDVGRFSKGEKILLFSSNVFHYV